MNTIHANEIVEGQSLSVPRYGLHLVEGVAIQGRTVVVRVSRYTTFGGRAFRTFTFPYTARVRVSG
jgi:hypothetical protein